MASNAVQLYALCFRVLYNWVHFAFSVDIAKVARASFYLQAHARWAWDIPIGYYMTTSYRFVVAMETGRVSYYVTFKFLTPGKEVM